MTLLTMGGLAALVISQTDKGTSSAHLTNPLTGSTLGSGPGGAAADISAAAAAPCQANYSAVAQAASYYAAEHGHPPTSMSDVVAMLKDPASGPGFTIAVDPAGRVTVATPGHPASPGQANCAYAT